MLVIPNIAFNAKARAREITKKNHILITVFQRYFINMNISVNAKTKENSSDIKDGVSWFSSGSSPYGKGFSVWFVVGSIFGV